jgi:hypothetical protein
MIGPGSLLLVVPHVCALLYYITKSLVSNYSFISGVAKKEKEKAKLRHLILLSRVTF